MPVSWEIRGNVVIVTVTADWERGGAETAILEALADPSFLPGSSLLLDVRRARTSPTAEEVSFRADWMASLRNKGLSRRCAIVVGPKAHQFGIARMAQARMDIRDMELQIFRDPEEALRWLSESGESASV
jgi:hypothetical protein